MAKNIFEMSKDGKSEYCIDVIKVGTLTPIEGSDFLAQTFIGDASIVVRKDQVKEGDLLFYASNECQLNEKFLSANNLFEIGCYEKNSNAQDVKELLDKADEYDGKVKQMEDSDNTTLMDEMLSQRDVYKTKAKAKCGFFSHNGRVRMIRLKKVPSMGYLFSKDEMVKYCPKVKNINMEDWLNIDFDTVDGELFVKAYIPPVKEQPIRGDGTKKKNKKLNRFDRMIPGEFSYHYDTQMLSKNMWQFSPTDNVVISNKLHGTSACFGNVKIKTPLKIAFYKRWFNNLVDKFGILKNYRITDSFVEYGNVYSSRTVIKNQYINKDVSNGYYGTDIWSKVNDIIKPYITEGMIVYGEICGWANENTMIQKGYDYGCKKGEFFFMPYRITTQIDDGKRYEWEVSDVRDWTLKLMKDHPEIADKLHPIDIFYEGTLANLYTEVSKTEHWHENILHKMMNDKEHFGMEELEPMCFNKVPREGICIRKSSDPIAECFKLKTVSFKEREMRSIDKGEVDMEMENAYGSN